MALILDPPFSTSASGQVDCSIPEALSFTRPNLDGAPTTVHLTVTMIDLVDLDEVAEAFTLDFIVQQSWSDPRLAEDSIGRSLENCAIGRTSVWHPEIHALIGRSLRREWPDLVEIGAQGQVRADQRHDGEISQPLDLRRFPFDQQTLKRRYFVEYDDDEVDFEMANPPNDHGLRTHH